MSGRPNHRRRWQSGLSRGIYRVAVLLGLVRSPTGATSMLRPTSPPPAPEPAAQADISTTTPKENCMAFRYVLVRAWVPDRRPTRPPYPDQGLPGYQPYPDQGLPGNQPYPDQGLPGNQPYPDQGLPGNQPYPDQGLPGWQPYPDQGLPGYQPRPDQGLPGYQPYPDQGLPGYQPYPDQGLPGYQPYPDQGLPRPPLGTWGGVRPPYIDIGFPGNQPYPGQGLPGNQPYPDQGLPGNQPYPGQGLPGNQPSVTPPIVVPPADQMPEHPELPDLNTGKWLYVYGADASYKVCFVPYPLVVTHPDYKPVYPEKGAPGEWITLVYNGRAQWGWLPSPDSGGYSE